MKIAYEFGRRPKHDDFDDIHPLSGNGEEFDEFEEEEEEEDEEVDFDNPTFKNDGIWTDYAEDLEFED